MNNELTITIKDTGKWLDVNCEWKADDRMLINAIRSLKDIGASLQKTTSNKRYKLLARIALYNLGQRLMKDNEPNIEAAEDAIAVLSEILVKFTD